jgi:hypothetical protein
MILLQSFTWYVLKALSCCNGRADVALLLLVLLRSSEVACQGGSAGSLGLDTALCCAGVTSRWLIDSRLCAVLHQASIVMNGDVTRKRHSSLLFSPHCGRLVAVAAGSAFEWDLPCLFVRVMDGPLSDDGLTVFSGPPAQQHSAVRRCNTLIQDNMRKP